MHFFPVVQHVLLLLDFACVVNNRKNGDCFMKATDISEVTP